MGTERPAPLRVLDLIAEGKRVVVIAPTHRHERLAFHDVMYAAQASIDCPVVFNLSHRTISDPRGRGMADFFTEDVGGDDRDPARRFRGLRFDVAWAPFGMDISTRHALNETMENPEWL